MNTEFEHERRIRALALLATSRAYADLNGVDLDSMSIDEQAAYISETSASLWREKIEKERSK